MNLSALQKDPVDLEESELYETIFKELEISPNRVSRDLDEFHTLAIIKNYLSDKDIYCYRVYVTFHEDESNGGSIRGSSCVYVISSEVYPIDKKEEAIDSFITKLTADKQTYLNIYKDEYSILK